MLLSLVFWITIQFDSIESGKKKDILKKNIMKVGLGGRSEKTTRLTIVLKSSNSVFIKTDKSQRRSTEVLQRYGRRCKGYNSLTDDKTLNQSMLKEFAEDKFNVVYVNCP